MRPLSSQWIPTKKAFCLVFSYLTLLSVSIPLQHFLESTLTALFLSFAEGQVFPLSHGLTLYLCFLMWPSKEFLSLLCEAFLWPLLTYPLLGWFPFLSVNNLTKLECLHRAASRAIPGCLSSSPISLLLSEASLPALRITLTHFARHLISWPFPVSSLARLGVKPRLCRSSWRAFASINPLMLPPTSPREVDFAFPPFPSRSLPSFIVEFTLSFPCSHSDPPLSLRCGSCSS